MSLYRVAQNSRFTCPVCGLRLLKGDKQEPAHADLDKPCLPRPFLALKNPQVITHVDHCRICNEDIVSGKETYTVVHTDCANMVIAKKTKGSTVLRCGRPSRTGVLSVNGCGRWLPRDHFTEARGDNVRICAECERTRQNYAMRLKRLSKQGIENPVLGIDWVIKNLEIHTQKVRDLRDQDSQETR